MRHRPNGSCVSSVCTTPTAPCVVSSPIGSVPASADATVRCARSPTAACVNVPSGRPARPGLPVPFDTYHRNDQPEPIRLAAGGRAPVVVAETASGHTLLLAPDDLEACDGSIDRLVEAIEQAATRADLSWAAR